MRRPHGDGFDAPISLPPLARAVQKAHCPRCAGYEDRVMRRKEGEAVPPEVTPCAGYAMSDRFRAWAVAQMSMEVGTQVRAAGLDRMAILRSAEQPEQAQRGEGGRPAP